MIIVDADYFIDVDQYNYIPKFDRHKTRVEKDGTETKITDVIGYYGTLEGALKGVVEDKIKKKISDDNIVNLEEAINVVISIKNELQKMYEGINIKCV